MSLRLDVAKFFVEWATEVHMMTVYVLQSRKTWRPAQGFRTFEE